MPSKSPKISVVKTSETHTSENLDKPTMEGKPRARGIYLLPNLLTTASLFAGFYAIVAGMKGQYDMAAIAIFVAMIMDALDGRIARLTNTQTAFGAEFDSLSDMVAFGITPALVVYSWSLFGSGKFGWLASFLYAACGALRLARFNTQLASADKRYFQGLPIPSAAAVIASIVWLCNAYDIPGIDVAVLVAPITILLAILMVSNIRYHSFKQIDIAGRVPFVAILIGVLIIVGISVDPPLVLFLVFTGYAASGPIFTLVNLRKTRKMRRQGPAEPEK